MAIDPVLLTLTAVVASAILYFLGSIATKKQTEKLIEEYHVDAEAVLTLVKTNGTETRKSIVESANKTLEVIERSHLVIKEELKDLSDPSGDSK